MFQGLKAEAPTYRHLLHWERVCRFLDAEPFGSVRWPYQSQADTPREAPPITTRLMKRMARFGLVRHKEDCSWKLSPRWRQILKRLWDDAPDEEAVAAPKDTAANPAPFVVDTNVDTLYVSLLADELPAHLLQHCMDLKNQAQADDQSVETPWLWFDAPLSMYKAGVGSSSKGRGASWGYVLRNEHVMLLLRKKELSGIIGSVRLSAKCLWTYGPRKALDGMRQALRRMWLDPHSFAELGFQVSQIHLCADIANFAPTPADLARTVTRSRRKAVHIPSLEDEADYLQDMLGDQIADPWDEVSTPDDWASVEMDDDLDQDEDDEDEEWNEADTEGALVHLWGERASGMSFSPGAPLSAVWYDKLLEERRSGKRWMQPYHEQGGWCPGMPLTRIEVRFRRDVLRELVAEFGNDADSWTDDPWLCLDHLNDLWAYAVGLPPDADNEPDVTHRGWMRLTLPDSEDTRKRRWQLDPVWGVIQSAVFSRTPPKSLKRSKRVDPSLKNLYAETYGMIKTIAVLRGSYIKGDAELARELEAVEDWAAEWQEQRGEPFADSVRERARMLGKALPLAKSPHLKDRKRTKDAS